MEEEKSSLHQGNTKMLRAVRIDVTVLMEAHETTEELIKFIGEFFCDQGDYQGLEAVVVSEVEGYVIPYSDEVN